MSNKLHNQESQYLSQHKDNPVHWWSYGDEAIDHAKRKNLPIFFSIGYSSCHWCHVMAKESFADQEVADFLNKNFVSIKIDKDEYPEIDSYYQQACQLFAGSGGWPLSAFALPDLRPFFAGTYFPKEPQENMPSFLNLIQEIKRAFEEEQDQVEENASRAFEQIKQGPDKSEKVEFEGHYPGPLSIIKAISEYIDKENGGFGKSPKFPHYPFLEWHAEQVLEGMIDKENGQPLLDTVENLALGGISDHLKGGVHRYSTDAQWKIPHFEKMLYDQAGYLKVLSKYSLIRPSAFIFDTVLNTLNYLETEMLNDKNYFHSSQSADSEGVEGLYYTFTSDEFSESILKSEFNKSDELTQHLDKLRSWFGITEKGNFSNGLNVLTLDKNLKDQYFNDQSWELVRKVKASLLKERQCRIPPSTDTKGIASWNFMTLSALADVYQYCPVEIIKDRAISLINQTYKGIYETFVRKDEILHSTTQDKTENYLEDHVFYAESLLRLYEVTAMDHLKSALKEQLNNIFNKFFSDDKVFKKFENKDQFFSPLSVIDTSFKAPLSTLTIVEKRAKRLFNKEFSSKLEAILDHYKNESLTNPIACGEIVRAFTYPAEIYRVVRVPKSWAKEKSFSQFIPFFLNRFIIDYKEEGAWKIESAKGIELEGSDFNDFVEKLAPKEKG